MKKTLQNNQGFTLIETMIAIAFLSIALLGSAALYLSAVKANTAGNTQSTATFVARTTLEEFKNFTLANFDTFVTSKGGSYNASDQLTFTDTVDERGQEDASGLYTRVVEVTRDTGFRNVRITIRWPQAKKVSDGLVISGMIRGGGL